MGPTWTIRAAAGTAPAAVPAQPERLLAEELTRLLREPRAARLAVELTEAAAALGVSKKFFDEHVRPELRFVRRGRKVLVPVSELERWLEESAALTLEDQR
jgi:excisionase family DNA binding protein